MNSARMFALTLLLAACAKPKPAPVIGNAPTRDPPPVDPEPEREGCESVASAVLNVAGERAMADLLSCDLGTKPYGDNDVDSGMTVNEREAWVKITRPKKPTLRLQIAAWTDGWEWGAEVALEGPLVSTGAANDALLVYHRQHSVDTNTVDLIAVAVQDGELKLIKSWSEDSLSVLMSKAGNVARVETCVIGDPAVAHAGCDGHPYADPGPVFHLRWTGSKLDEAARP